MDDMKKSQMILLIEHLCTSQTDTLVSTPLPFPSQDSDYSPERMSWNYSCFHALSAFLSVLQVKWSMLCQHLAVNLLSYLTLYHSPCWDPPHDPCLWGRRDTETGFLSLICLAWPTQWVKSLPRRKSGRLCSRPSSLEEELLLTFVCIWADKREYLLWCVNCEHALRPLRKVTTGCIGQKN